MKRLLALLVLLLLAFYVAWPGWSAYQIATAIKARDEATLDRKIVFDGVRQSLRPAAMDKVSEAYDAATAKAGASFRPIIAQMKQEFVPKIADQALSTLVTSRNLIRVVNDGGSLKENAERIMREQIGRIGLPGLEAIGGGKPGAGGSGGSGGGLNLPGGLGNIAGKMGIDLKQIPGIGGAGNARPEATPAPEPAAPPASAPAGEQGRRFGLSNVKRFSFLGPLAFEIGVAKEASVREADAIVEVRFVNGDWRVTGVRPRL